MQKKYKYLVSVYKLTASYSNKLNKIVRRWRFVFGLYFFTKEEAIRYIRARITTDEKGCKVTLQALRKGV